MDWKHPKWVVILGVIVTVEQAVGSGTIHLTHMIPDAWIPTAVAWNQSLAFVGTTIMTALAGGQMASKS